MTIEIVTDPSGRERDGLLKIEVKYQGRDYTLDLPFENLYERCGVPDNLTLDLLIVAALCYTVDKIVPRGHTSDNWTRELEVEFPVSMPATWQSAAVKLETVLNFLTGDYWHLSFRDVEAPFFQPQRKRHRRGLPVGQIEETAVCLFSGGLDSLIGAIDLLERSADETLLLIGHYDSPGPATQQNNLLAEVDRTYVRRTELLQSRVSHKPVAAPELTLRSRSLIFMALAIYAARSSGRDTPVYAPENGLIAINVPITPSRSGSCSTRTMHPFYVERFKSLLSDLGLATKITNPLRLKTKGEAVEECLNLPLLRGIANLSVSCSHGSRKQNWIRRQAKNCGYCFPCLIRRSALHKARMDEGQEYGIDVCGGELPMDDSESAGDLRALLDFLDSRRSVAEIAIEIRAVAPITDVSEYATMVERGSDELRALLRDKSKFHAPDSSSAATSQA